jgi:hypothetical protein
MCSLSAYAEKSTVDGRSNHKRQVQEVLARSPRELPGVLLTVLPIILGYDSSPLGPTPKPDGAMEGLGSQRYYTTCCGGTAQGALGARDGAITHSLLKRATRSLLVVVLPPAAFVLLLILCFLASSKSL